MPKAFTQNQREQPEASPFWSGWVGGSGLETLSQGGEWGSDQKEEGARGGVGPT